MKRAKKVLIFATAYLPLVGGAEIAIKEITDRLGDDYSFDLITAKLKSDLPSFEKIGNGITVYRIGLGVPILDKILIPFWGALKVKKLNKKNKYDLFWCVMVSWAGGAAYIANIFSRKKTPIILTLQEGDSEEHFKNRWFGLINLSWRFALKSTSFLTVISSYLAVRARNFGYKDKLEIIPNGVNLKIFPKIFNLEGWDKAVSVINDEKISYMYLWTFSRLTEKNGIKDLIKAVALLNSKFKLRNKFKLLIFGEGYLRNELEKLAKKLNVDNQLVFFGNKKQEEIVEIMKKYEMFFRSINVWHIFVRPSISEGFGNAFVEAMAAGIPVIATPVGGIPDFLKDRETGLFCRVNDPESIAEKVLEYMKNPKLASSIVNNARKMVEEKYNWDKIALQMKGVFDGLK